jgi:hypothetical protein
MKAAATNAVITLGRSRRSGLLQAALALGNALLAHVRETVSGVDPTHREELAAMDARMLRDIGADGWIGSHVLALRELQYPRL